MLFNQLILLRENIIHPFLLFPVFHNENLEKYQFICKICKPGKDVNLDGLKALENHLESDEHSNSIKLHLPENNQQVKVCK